MFDLLRNILLAGLGVQEKIKESIDDLVKRGELSESQGAKIIKEWTEKANRSTADLRNDIYDLVNKTLEKMNIPAKEDLERLQRKVDELTTRVEMLEKAQKDGNQS
ncbi:MAG: phasin family protein [Thermodesulfovibrionales bacterium]|nr:phasin family protein [Thermodesulfovibrionales bacterium]